MPLALESNEKMYHFCMELEIPEKELTHFKSNLAEMLRKKDANDFFEYAARTYDKSGEEGQTKFTIKVKSNQKIKVSDFISHAKEVMTVLDEDFNIDVSQLTFSNSKKMTEDTPFSLALKEECTRLAKAQADSKTPLERMQSILKQEEGINKLTTAERLLKSNALPTIEHELKEEQAALNKRYQEIKQAKAQQQELEEKIFQIKASIAAPSSLDTKQDKSLQSVSNIASIAFPKPHEATRASLTESNRTAHADFVSAKKVARKIETYSTNPSSIETLKDDHNLHMPSKKMMGFTKADTQQYLKAKAFDRNMTHALKEAENKFSDIKNTTVRIETLYNQIDALKGELYGLNPELTEATNEVLQKELSNLSTALAMKEAFIAQYETQAPPSPIRETTEKEALTDAELSSSESENESETQEKVTVSDEKFQMHHFQLAVEIDNHSKPGYAQVLEHLKKTMPDSMFSFTLKPSSKSESPLDSFTLKVKGTPPPLGIGKESPIKNASFNQFKAELTQALSLCHSYGIDVQTLKTVAGNNEQKYITRDNLKKLQTATDTIKRKYPSEPLSAVSAVLRGENHEFAQITQLSNGQGLQANLDMLKAEKNQLENELSAIKTAHLEKEDLIILIEQTEKALEKIDVSKGDPGAMAEVQKIAQTPCKEKAESKKKHYPIKSKKDFTALFEVESLTKLYASQEGAKRYFETLFSAEINGFEKKSFLKSDTQPGIQAQKTYDTNIQAAILEGGQKIKALDELRKTTLEAFYEVNGNNPHDQTMQGLKQQVNSQLSAAEINAENDVLREQLANMTLALSLGQGLEMKNAPTVELLQQQAPNETNKALNAQVQAPQPPKEKGAFQQSAVPPSPLNGFKDKRVDSSSLFAARNPSNPNQKATEKPAAQQEAPSNLRKS